jgi:prophage regulatory protein
MISRLIKRKEVEDITSLSTATIYRLMAEGKFPVQVKITGRSVAWLESDISEWVEQKIASSKVMA